MCSTGVWQVFYAFHQRYLKLIWVIAEFRGPGVHHSFDDSDSGYDVDLDSKPKPFGNQKGRIILLGDGTEVLTDSDDTEMFDHGEEDKDLASQVHKGQTTGHESSGAAISTTGDLPDKIDVKDPKIRAVADKVLSNSSESSDKATGEVESNIKDK